MSFEDLHGIGQAEEIFSMEHSDLAEVQFPFLPHECSPTHHSLAIAESTDGPNFFSGCGGLDEKALDRFLELDSIAIECLIPSQDMSTATEPCSLPFECGTSNEVSSKSAHTIAAKHPDFHQETQLPSNTGAKSLSVRDQQRDGGKEKLTGRIDLAEESFEDPKRVVQTLCSLTAEEFRRALKASKGTIARKVGTFWKSYHPVLEETAEKAQILVNRRGVKMKRRKRMGSDIPAIEKKEIRAQRNRERSQALRRYHKQRLLDLEQIGNEMKACNMATRSIINCLLEDESSLAALNKYFAANECTEVLLGFLSE